MKNLASSCKNRRENGNGRPSRTGGTPAAAPGHRRLRANASTPSWGSRLASRPASTARKRAGEAGKRTPDREQSRERFGGACDRERPRRTPDRQGNAHAHGRSGSGQKTATAHAESGRGVTDSDPRNETSHDATESFHAESGSGQKTATAHSVRDHKKSVTRTMTAFYAHDRLTANGKRSESESDSDVHES